MFSKFISGLAETFGIQHNEDAILTTQTQQTTDQINTQDLIDQFQTPDQKQLRLIKHKIEEQKQSQKSLRSMKQRASNSPGKERSLSINKNRNSINVRPQKLTHLLKLNPQTLSKCQSTNKIMVSQRSISQLSVQDVKFPNDYQVNNKNVKNILINQNHKVEPRHQRLTSNTQYSQILPLNMTGLMKISSQESLQTKCLSPRSSTMKINPLVTQSCKKLPNTVYVPSRNLDQVDEVSINSGEDDIPLESLQIVDKRQARVTNTEKVLHKKRPQDIEKEDFFKKLLKNKESQIEEVNLFKIAEQVNFTSYYKINQKTALGTEKTSLNSIIGNTNKFIQNQLPSHGHSNKLTASTTPNKIQYAGKKQMYSFKQSNNSKPSQQQQINQNPFKTIQDNRFQAKGDFIQPETASELQVFQNLESNCSDLQSLCNYDNVARTLSQDVIQEAASDSSPCFYPSNQSNFNYVPKFFKPSQQSSSVQSVHRKMSVSNQTQNFNNFTNSTFQNDLLPPSTTASPLTLLYKKLHSQGSQPQLINIQDKLIISEFMMEENNVIHEKPPKQKGKKIVQQNQNSLQKSKFNQSKRLNQNIVSQSNLQLHPQKLQNVTKTNNNLQNNANPTSLREMTQNSKQYTMSQVKLIQTSASQMSVRDLHNNSKIAQIKNLQQRQQNIKAKK
eukprot:403358728